jgi:ATP-dependent RNA helicase HrpB
VPEIVAAARSSRAVVVTAEPGAGKTTRVPPALTADGPVILLQPRRVAARSIAARVAFEQGWTIGQEIGWHIRFEHRFGRDTRLLVATEGILTTRLQQDPLLSSFTTIVLDEFHERSIHADLAIALAKQAWRARADLRVVVMSATLDAGAVAAFLDDCPVVSVPGRLHPLTIDYSPGQSVAHAVAGVLAGGPRDVLCFLPGAYEIRKAAADIETLHHDVDVIPLYGALDSAEQDRALRESSTNRPRVIVATNIAETSVTVPGVTAVVDSGLQKVARYDAERGIDSLVTERITQDSADQRAGRAGRLAPGLVWRLWDPRDRLRPHREPEIHRIDLASAVLDVLAWGSGPRDFEWFERPSEDTIDAALFLLERLGAVKAGRLTDDGRRIQKLSLHPRLARMLIAAGGSQRMARACALLSERHFFGQTAASTTSDLLSASDNWGAVPPHVQRVANEIERSTRDAGGFPAARRPEASDEDFRKAVLAGYPDRVAQRREPRSPRVKLATGAGAAVGPQSGVRDFEFLVAVDVQAPARPGAADSVIRVASAVEREWLEPNAIERVHRFDEASGKVRAFEIEKYDALTLVERPVPADAEIAAGILVERWLERGPADEDVRLLRRLKFVGRELDLPSLVRAAAQSARSLSDVRLAEALATGDRSALDRDAPETLMVPSGRRVPLEYADDGSVTASVKLQELFGLAETPRIGPRREPVVFALLAPNGRPVQVTRDLRSFWERTYPEVRKELRGRYPKHPWPEDPWTATPTARTRKKPQLS